MEPSVAFQLGYAYASALVLGRAEKLLPPEERKHSAPWNNYLHEPMERVGIARVLAGMPLGRIDSYGAFAEELRRRAESHVGTAEAQFAYRLGRAGGEAVNALRMTMFLSGIAAKHDVAAARDAERAVLERASAELDELARSSGPPKLVAKAAELARLAADSKALAGRDPQALVNRLEEALRDKYLWQDPPAAEAPLSPQAEPLRARVLSAPDRDDYSIDADNAVRRELARAARPQAADLADLIEVQIDVHEAEMGDSRVDVVALRRRERDILERRSRTWAADVIRVTRQVRFRRGFVGEIAIAARAFLDHATSIYSQAPVTIVRIMDGTADLIRQVVTSPALARIRALDLGAQPVGDAGLAALAGSPHAARLVALNLVGADFTRDGVLALAASPSLGSLARVWFGGGDDPTERPMQLTPEGYPHDYVLPPFGQEIEARFGKRAWLRTERWDTRSPDIEAVLHHAERDKKAS